MLLALGFLIAALEALPADLSVLESARDRQEPSTLRAQFALLAEASRKSPDDPEAHYWVALASSYLAEVLLELGDRAGALKAAEQGLLHAQRAAALRPGSGEYHRLVGVLCGQMVAGSLLSALQHGRCAASSLQKAVELDPNSWKVYLSRGVGLYYLPPAFGGGLELAMKDFQRALDLNPKAAEVYLWLGIALRKAGRLEEARRAIQRSLELNPHRKWARQQLEKTPPAKRP